MLGLLVPSENMHKIHLISPEFLTLDHMGCLEPKFHEAGTFGGFGKRELTDTYDSCFISIDWFSY